MRPSPTIHTTGGYNVDPQACTAARYGGRNYLTKYAPVPTWPCALFTGRASLSIVLTRLVQTLRPNLEPCPPTIVALDLSAHHGMLAVVAGDSLVFYRPVPNPQPHSISNPYRWEYHEAYATDSAGTGVRWSDHYTVIVGTHNGVSVWVAHAQALSQIACWSKAWETGLAQPCQRIEPGPHQGDFATLGRYDRWVKVWHHTLDQHWGFHYLPHPHYVTNIAWRTRSKIPGTPTDPPPSATATTAIITVCIDGCTRIWRPHYHDRAAPFVLVCTLDPTQWLPPLAAALPDVWQACSFDPPSLSVANTQVSPTDRDSLTHRFPFAYWVDTQPLGMDRHLSRSGPLLTNLQPDDELFVSLLPGGALLFWAVTLDIFQAGGCTVPRFILYSARPNDAEQITRNDLVEQPRFFPHPNLPDTALFCLLRYADGSISQHLWVPRLLYSLTDPGPAETNRAGSIDAPASSRTYRTGLARTPSGSSKLWGTSPRSDHSRFGASPLVHPPLPDHPNGSLSSVSLATPSAIPVSVFTNLQHDQPGWAPWVAYDGPGPWPVVKLRPAPSQPGDAAPGSTGPEPNVTILILTARPTPTRPRSLTANHTGVCNGSPTRMAWTIMYPAPSTAGNDWTKVATGLVPETVTGLESRVSPCDAYWLSNGSGFIVQCGCILFLYLDLHHWNHAVDSIADATAPIVGQPLFQLVWSDSLTRLLPLGDRANPSALWAIRPAPISPPTKIGELNDAKYANPVDLMTLEVVSNSNRPNDPYWINLQLRPDAYRNWLKDADCVCTIPQWGASDS
ncbi:hypothetical protein BJ085DRAFT_35845, partial [Dimargaris cristalligena]